MVVLSIIIIYVISTVTHLLEAKIEKRQGDVIHWDSILTQYIIGSWMAWVLPTPFYFGAIIVTGVRVFFDWMYNYYKGHKLSYLGDNSRSDILLKKYNIPTWIISVGRVFTAVVCILALYLLSK